MSWKPKLDKFMESFEYKADVIGILVCGSFVTGTPSSHSDLDVHIILDESVDYRERGNKIVDGLLIEYFVNPPRQIRSYFKEDYQAIRPMSQTQFATGEIVLDTTGVVAELKQEAIAMIELNFKDIHSSAHGLVKYGIWDMLDDLQDMYENERIEFDFVYYSNLDELISIYMKQIKQAYNKKTILGHLMSEVVRKKYLLNELPDENVKNLIQTCIVAEGKKDRIESYEKLTNAVLDLMGGFEIDGFKFKSDVSE
jgi:hypothetical protein